MSDDVVMMVSKNLEVSVGVVVADILSVAVGEATEVVIGVELD